MHSRLGARSGYCLSTLEEMGSRISSSRDGPHQPFPEQVESLALQEFTTSIAESDVVGNVNNATTHSTHPREPNVSVLADTGNYAPTASSITTLLIDSWPNEFSHQIRGLVASELKTSSVPGSSQR